MSLKEEFVNNLVTLVGEFEGKTGVEIFNIEFGRIDTCSAGQLSEETSITKIKVDMR